jgi:putative salt-induced outer membrane protein YdiY
MDKRLILLFIIPATLFAIRPINIFQIGEKENGYYGDVDLAITTTRGNSEAESYSVGGSLQKFNENNIWLFNGTKNFSQSQGVTTADKSYVHLRNIRRAYRHEKYLGEVDWEFFTQVEQNKFQKIEFRGLAGIGFRFKPIVDEDFFVGISPMFVRETYLGLTTHEDVFRMNYYINFKNEFNKRSSISYTMYYQPRMRKQEDFDLIQKFLFKNKITDKLSIKIQFSYDYDSHPIENLKRYDISQTTLFSYEF